MIKCVYILQVKDPVLGVWHSHEFYAYQSLLDWYAENVPQNYSVRAYQKVITLKAIEI